jgi:hypothetical protein
MIKNKVNQSGFSAVVVVLIAVIIGIIGFTGWYVYSAVQKNNKELDKPSSLQSETQNYTVPASTSRTNQELITYKDDYISFQYPKDWVAKNDYKFTDSYGAYSLMIKTPVDPNLVAADPNNKNINLEVSVLIDKEDSNRFKQGCPACGEVYDVEKSSLMGSDAYIVISASGTKNPEMIAVNKSNLALGTKTWGGNSGTPVGLKIGNYALVISANYRSGDTSYVGLKDVKTVKDSTQYNQFKELIKTIKVNSNSLPN